MKATSYSLLLLILISCSGKEHTMDLDKKGTAYAVREMLDNYHNDIARDGLTAEFKYLDNSSDFFWVPPGYNTALSYDSVRTILEENSKMFHSVMFQWESLQVFPLTNEIANYTGILKSHMIDTARVESSVTMIESGTLIKREDGWKLLSGQSRLLEN